MYYYLDILKKKKHILYLNFIRLRIYYSNKPNDIIKILNKSYCGIIRKPSLEGTHGKIMPSVE